MEIIPKQFIDSGSPTERSQLDMIASCAEFPTPSTESVTRFLAIINERADSSMRDFAERCRGFTARTASEDPLRLEESTSWPLGAPNP